ncbi:MULTISPECIES: preprotein translocase subunit SecG [Streptococcus]|uniref:Protein-export membrane protein SecG n=1 Tax=Streptococcus sinensis TaxID=176090 RepID=A0A0A0DEP0_9STRE|nr:MULTISPECIES: preprotein translocase subunit SecG [Streptococcus]KGM36318.1 Preprotein translocase subunit SecG [Streptococcus sinensis]KXT65480.1 Preprotein translocase subunit SecG [Streptococcus sp. DD04]MCD1276352.1 preprotein translocase subunit SecG [Streptococcus sinensis]MCF1283918.1 preprotein translocase subunit SecG [Streptococcus sinensis]MCY7217594.1 preprotein translocase subunit SecG [Streptococcus cristatus]
MYSLLLTILVILSAFIIIAIFMQPTKNQSSNVFDSSANDLFERSKARGFEAVMQRLTGVMIFFWLLIALVLAVLSSK